MLGSEIFDVRLSVNQPVYFLGSDIRLIKRGRLLSIEPIEDSAGNLRIYPTDHYDAASEASLAVAGLRSVDVATEDELKMIAADQLGLASDLQNVLDLDIAGLLDHEPHNRALAAALHAVIAERIPQNCFMSSQFES